MRRDRYGNAKLYEIFIDPLMTDLRAVGMKMWPPRQGMLVLDVGCGTGAHLDLYQKARCESFGIDLSPAMLKVAKKKLHDRANLHMGDASQMPYRDRTFDLVVLSMALHQVPSAIRSAEIKESKRILKKNGRILVIDYHPGPMPFPEGWFYRILIFFIELFAGFEHFKNYWDFLTRGGFPPLSAKHELYTEKEKIVAKGNVGVFLLRLE